MVKVDKSELMNYRIALVDSVPKEFQSYISSEFCTVHDKANPNPRVLYTAKRTQVLYEIGKLFFSNYNKNKEPLYIREIFEKLPDPEKPKKGFLKSRIGSDTFVDSIYREEKTKAIIQTDVHESVYDEVPEYTEGQEGPDYILVTKQRRVQYGLAGKGLLGIKEIASFVCYHCKKKVKAVVGKTTNCPKCGEVVDIENIRPRKPTTKRYCYPIAVILKTKDGKDSIDFSKYLVKDPSWMRHIYIKELGKELDEGELSLQQLIPPQLDKEEVKEVLNRIIDLAKKNTDSLTSKMVEKEIKRLGDEKETKKILGEKREVIRDLEKEGTGLIKTIDREISEFKKIMDSFIPKVELPSIRTILKDGKTSTPDFFKKDPEWIDFEEGYIIQRNEVALIIENLAEHPIQLILGAPAAGKSIILKNIGFKLARDEGWNVYFIDFDKYPKEQLLECLMNVIKLDDEKTLIILDDAHFDLPTCETLLSNFKNKNIKSKLIIGSRKTKRITMEHPIEPSAFEDLIKVEISSADIVGELIHLFLYKKHRLNNERIEIISKNLNKYKRNLWYLSWALKAFTPDKDTVEDTDIYKKLLVYITNINVGKANFINAENILLPLSVFFRYEIAVERRFLENQLKIRGALIDQLVVIGEIVKWIGPKGGELIALHHSSIAELYFDTYKHYDNLGKKIKEEVEENFDYWDIGLIHLFFQSKPGNPIGHLSKLSNAHIDGFIQEDPIRELLGDTETKEKIFQKIDESMIARNVRNLADDLSRIPNLKFRNEFLNEYHSTSTLLTFLNDSKLNQIGHFLGYGGGYYPINVRNAYKMFVEESYLSKKMEESQLGEINSFIHAISRVQFRKYPNIGRKLAEDAVQKLIGIDNLPQKLTDSTIEEIRHLIKNTFDNACDPQFIVDIISPPFNLITKLEESTLNDINMLIRIIDSIGTTTEELTSNSKFIIDKIKQIDRSKLTQKLEESTLQYINHFFANLKRNNGESEEYILNLIRQLDLTEKLKETSLFSIDVILEGELDKNIISGKLKSIFQEHGFPLSYLANLAKVEENTWTIVGERNFILRKENEQINVYQESNLSDISWFLWNISDDNSLSAKILGVLDNTDLIEKIEDTNLESVNYFHWNLFQISSVVPKIFSNEDVNNILLNRMSKHDESIGEKLRLIGILKYASSSILEKSLEKVFMTAEAEKELKKWFSKNHDHPYKIALALEGFSIVNEKKSLSFINTYLNLKEIINTLEDAGIKNKKAERLIRNALGWLADGFQNY